MRYLVLATAVITTMSSGAIARQYIEGQELDIEGQELAAQNLQDVRATPVSSDQQGAAGVIRIAMGPTSAARKPGGTAVVPILTPSKCSSSVGSCANDRAVKRHTKT